ncbi:MAG: hypothetical protein N2645_21750 [Clostridia bacterium]|nr:hypothetical protein [Clostridia bacterium]
MKELIMNLVGIVITISLLWLVIILPVWMFISNVGRLISSFKKNYKTRDESLKRLVFDVVGIGFIPFISFMFFNGLRDYNEPIIIPNDFFHLHTPFSKEHFLTIVGLFLFSVLSLWIKRVFRENLSPVLLVLSSVGILQGIVLNIFILVQLISNVDILTLWFIIFFSMNTIVVYLTELQTGFREFVELEKLTEKKYSSKFLQKIYWNLIHWKWYMNPWLFLLLIPFTVILQAILILFGQKPDSCIEAFTKTCDWTFSQYQPPAPVKVDPHYLCTIASKGHEGLVKPLRLGIRGGTIIKVNRQLLIANAFENILEEYVPKFHKAVRRVYGKIGIPLYRWVENVWIADAFYIIMKPLEFFFLFCIYLIDVKPENRIGRQYIPSNLIISGKEAGE